MGGQTRGHRSHAEESDVGAVDCVEHRLDGALAPQGFLGVRIVEEGGDREIDDAPADGLGCPGDDGFCVGHARLGGCGCAVELDDGGARERHVRHCSRDLRGRVSPGDAEGDAGEEHVDEVLRGDEGNVVQAIDLGVDVVNGNDGDLDTEQVGDLASEGAFEPGGGGH